MRKINRIRLFLRILNDEKEGREEIGQDKYGNKLYQYYSFFGLPIRRECEYINRYKFHQQSDKAYYFWLKNQQVFPPTREQALI